MGFYALLLEVIEDQPGGPVIEDQPGGPVIEDQPAKPLTAVDEHVATPNPKSASTAMEGGEQSKVLQYEMMSVKSLRTLMQVWG